VVIHTVEQLGKNMSLLPNGSLLCRNVPLARTGWMMYGPGETPIKAGDGTHVAYVERTEKTLFADSCLGSFVGAAVVDEHPDPRLYPDGVTPQNDSKLRKGMVLVARRGTGDDADVILGDLLITDAGLIASINPGRPELGKREVSAGYDANYKQTGDGLGMQTDIIVNHVALVERGRCGPRCAIGDHEYQPPLKKGNPIMGKRVQIKTGGARRVTLDSQRKRVADAEAELAQANEDLQALEAGGDEDDTGTGATHIHIHTGSDGPADSDAQAGANKETGNDGNGGQSADPMEARITAIETSIQQLTDTVAKLVSGGGGESQDDGMGGSEDDGPAGGDAIGGADKNGQGTGDDGMGPDEEKKDEKTKTMDSAALETSFTGLLAKAEILFPGFRVPTFDAAAKRHATIDTMCNLRRKVLDAAYMTKDGQALINGVTGAKSLALDKMGCGGVATLFNAVAATKAASNNAHATRDSGKQVVQHQNAKVVVPKSLADINKANEAFWAKQTPKL
jgi:hypothetical protein